MLASSFRTDGPIVILPPVLRSFAEHSVGAVHEAVDCSWPREASRVWRITAGLRNILWDSATRALALIDFERAEYGPAVRDLIRLEYGPWDGRPDFKQAFFDGFGPALTALETCHLHVMAALDAVSGIAYGLEAGDDEVVTRGHRTLRRLLRVPNRR